MYDMAFLTTGCTWMCVCVGEARVDGAEFAEQGLAGEESQTVLHIRVHLGIRRLVGHLLYLCLLLSLSYPLTHSHSGQVP